MSAKVYCFRCEADKRSPPGLFSENKNGHILHNIMCEHATDESIKEAGDNHMNRFTALWTAVASWLNVKEKD